MKRFVRGFAAVLLSLFVIGFTLGPDDDGGKKANGFTFTVTKKVETTPVKDQGRTGTCWSFATTSFIETEVIRTSQVELDLSEMYNVRLTYPRKAMNYVRLHGNTVFGPGSLGGDALYVVRHYGLVPEIVYDGVIEGGKGHNHSELHSVLEGMLGNVVKNGQGVVTPVWSKAFEAVLDAYLGPVPSRFEYEGKTYTPQSFLEYVNFDPEAYVELTSFTHHPFYDRFSIEVPDNWARNESYNIPLDELISVMDHALENGYSVAWDGDVSERTFCYQQGVAILPEKAWEEKDANERAQVCEVPEKELNVTQEIRQSFFENHTSTDDHLMHLIGIAKDQDGNRYFLTKNSWGVENSRFNGYLYMSDSYVRAKTISVIVHKDAIPVEIAKKIGLST